ncbi:MAG: hypothetical protein ACK4PG_09845 [Acetobacteraceae bacterium]
MTPRDAERVFADHGLDAARLDQDALRHAWLQATGGADPARDEDAARLDAAHAVLDRQVRATPPRPAGPPFAPRPQFDDPKRDGFAVWAWAGVDGQPASDRIERADCSDRNFVKRRMWELSGRRTDEWTIWPFNGHGFLAPLTVYATSDQFPDMVHAAQDFARVGGVPPVAVGAARSIGGFAFWLIGIGATPLAKPERYPLAHDDPRQDVALLRRLKARVSG